MGRGSEGEGGVGGGRVLRGWGREGEGVGGRGVNNSISLHFCKLWQDIWTFFNFKA